MLGIDTFAKVFISNPSSLQTILIKQPNFRDLGGIPTSEGHVIKSGLIFRSGDLHTLSEADQLILEKLGLAMIIDLRAPREIEARPDKRISTVKEVIHLPIHDLARETAEKYFENDDAIGLETILIEDYRRIVTGYIHEFREFFRVVSTTHNLPLVFHCTAGKDRTGLAAVFLLSALGVGLPEIWKNYLDTNFYALSMTDRIIGKVSENGKNGEILRPLLEVRKDYLNAALEQIEISYGGMETFLKTTLGVDFSLLRLRFLK
jgi:protein-tyrosine phosphatase